MPRNCARCCIKTFSLSLVLSTQLHFKWCPNRKKRFFCWYRWNMKRLNWAERKILDTVYRKALETDKTSMSHIILLGRFRLGFFFVWACSTSCAIVLSFQCDYMFLFILCEDLSLHSQWMSHRLWAIVDILFKIVRRFIGFVSHCHGLSVLLPLKRQ